MGEADTHPQGEQPACNTQCTRQPFTQEERAPHRLQGGKKKKGKHLATELRGLGLPPHTCRPALAPAALGRSHFAADRTDASRRNTVHIASHIFINISAMAPPHCL